MLNYNAKELKAEVLKNGYIVCRNLGLSNESRANIDKELLSIASEFGRATGHQQGKGPIVWDIRDRGEAVASTGSERVGEFSYHTDSSFIDNPDKYILLYCIEPAKCGGGSNRLLHSKHIVNYLSKNKYLFKLFKIKFPFSTPKSFLPAGINKKIIYKRILGSGPIVRWKRDDIISALDDLGIHNKYYDIVLADIENIIFKLDAVHAVEYTLMKDDLIIIDNHHILHSRTNYTDPSRHLLRIKIQDQ